MDEVGCTAVLLNKDGAHLTDLAAIQSSKLYKVSYAQGVLWDVLLPKQSIAIVLTNVSEVSIKPRIDQLMWAHQKLFVFTKATLNITDFIVLSKELQGITILPYLDSFDVHEGLQKLVKSLDEFTEPDTLKDVKLSSDIVSNMTWSEELLPDDMCARILEKYETINDLLSPRENKGELEEHISNFMENEYIVE